MYFTQNWQAARTSVERLSSLEPEVVVSMHGRAMQGQGMRDALHQLARNFDEVAVPESGRYVANPHPGMGALHSPEESYQSRVTAGNPETTYNDRQRDV